MKTNGLLYAQQRVMISQPTFSLVPTPSVPDTRTGSTKPAAFRSKSPAKPPSSALHPGQQRRGGEKNFIMIISMVMKIRKGLKLLSKKSIV